MGKRSHERLNQKRHAWAGNKYTPMPAPWWRPKPRSKLAEAIEIARADIADLERHHARQPNAWLTREIAERKQRLASLQTQRLIELRG